MASENRPSVQVIYCPKCKWLARAAWYAQEILSTYSNDLADLRLVPSSEAGVFQISIDDVTLMDRRKDGFLEAKILKRSIRDYIDPDRTLGHIDQ